MEEIMPEVRSVWVIVRYKDEQRIKNMMAITSEAEAKALCVDISMDDLKHGEEDFYYKIEPLTFIDLEKAEN